MDLSYRKKQLVYITSFCYKNLVVFTKILNFILAVTYLLTY